MIDAVNVATQSVATNAVVLFSSTRIHTGCSARHEPGSGRFVLLKPGVYEVEFNANVSIPTGGTVGPITLSIVQDGEAVAGSRMIFTPAAATVPNIRRVAPPNTGSGINENTTPTIGKNPSNTRNSAMKYPTYLLATPVSWIIPLFCAKIEFGNELSAPAMNELRPSANIPPCALLRNFSPSTGSPDISELAVMSPYASIAVMTYTIANARIAERLNDTPYLKGTGILKSS